MKIEHLFWTILSLAMLLVIYFIVISLIEYRRLKKELEEMENEELERLNIRKERPHIDLTKFKI